MSNLYIHDVQDRPSIFHVTQHKCASQWVAEILKYCAYRRVVMPQPRQAHFSGVNVELVQGLIYPTLYIDRDSFNQTLLQNHHIQNYKVFLVTRDLRDLLISLYFSIRNSHASGFKGVDDNRAALNKLTLEDGLCYLISTQLQDESRLQDSWIGSDIKTFKYEDLIMNERGMIKKILEHCEIEVDKKQFDLVMKNNNFKMLSGRNKGHEDKKHHYRKGISGDWKNYFTPLVKNEFKKKFNRTLISYGYEAHNDW